MKNLLSTVALVAMVSGASAADWETKYQEPFAGLNGALTILGSYESDTACYYICASASVSQIGMGSYLGYNWQYGSFVIGGGLDTSIGYGKVEVNAGYYGRGSEGSLATDLGGLVKAGFAFDQTMIYVAGGGHWSGLNGDGWSVDATGWSAGGGIEHKLSDKWGIKLEAIYMNSRQAVQPRLGVSIYY